MKRFRNVTVFFFLFVKIKNAENIKTRCCERAALCVCCVDSRKANGVNAIITRGERKTATEVTRINASTEYSAGIKSGDDIIIIIL